MLPLPLERLHDLDPGGVGRLPCERVERAAHDHRSTTQPDLRLQLTQQRALAHAGLAKHRHSAGASVHRLVQQS